MQPILLFLDSQTAVAANTMAQTAATTTTTTLNQTALNQESSNNAGGGTMEIVIRRVGMEDHINIVKLFQVCYLLISWELFCRIYIGLCLFLHKTLLKYAGLTILRNHTDCLKVGIIGTFNKIQVLKTNPVNDLLFLSSTYNSKYYL